MQPGCPSCREPFNLKFIEEPSVVALNGNISERLELSQNIIIPMALNESFKLQGCLQKNCLSFDRSNNLYFDM